MTTFPPFDTRVDWCGGKGFSCVVPDSLCGVYIGQCCYFHDRNYAEARISRKQADIDFRKHLYQTLREGGIGRIRAWWRARAYYRAVRIFGASHYGQENNQCEKPSR